jgi:hypothetical protein
LKNCGDDCSTVDFIEEGEVEYEGSYEQPFSYHNGQEDEKPLSEKENNISKMIVFI